jgi:hypothetical protein
MLVYSTIKKTSVSEFESPGVSSGSEVFLPNKF